MATLSVLGMFILVGLAFTEKPTYEEILIRAKSGMLPNSDSEVVDRSDSGQIFEGTY